MKRRDLFIAIRLIFCALSIVGISLAVVLSLSTRSSIQIDKNSDSFGIHSDHLRNKRYCEVLYGERAFFNLRIKVFSTEGINDCSADLWAQITKESVVATRGASFVLLNGPRFWVMDQINVVNGGAEKADEMFVNLQMRQRATLTINIWDQLFQPQFYSARAINRKTEFIYRAGSNIYELISPQGEVYVMQSYSQMVDKNLAEDGLLLLGEKLILPQGWKFRVVKKGRDLTLRANSVAHVLQDNLRNSYQRQ